MTILAAILVTLGCLLGVLLTLITLPGTWVMLLLALACWAWRPELFTWHPLVAALVLAILAEVAEFLGSAVGASRAGGTRSGVIGAVGGAFIGLILGSIFLPIPIVGSIVGAVVGAGLGAGAGERTLGKQTWHASWTIGVGAARGRLIAIIVKTAFAGAMAIVLVTAAFWP